jgi:flagellar basal body P-ring protein FlgI
LKSNTLDFSSIKKTLMFRRQNLNIPLHKGGFLTPQKAAEVITRAFQMTSVGFEFVQVDKPQGISCS